MATGAAIGGHVHFSTAGLAERDRFTAFCRHLDAVYPAGVTIRQPSEDLFFASSRGRQLLHAGFARARYGATLTRLEKDTNDDFTLVTNVAGTVFASQRGKDAWLKPGDAYLVTSCEPQLFERHTSGEIFAVRVRRDDMAPLLQHADDHPGRTIPSGTQGLQLLHRYIGLLDEFAPLEDTKTLALATGHVHDLLALALGAEGEARERAGQRGLRAAQLMIIKAHIERNLSHSDLSPDALAARFGMSARSIQRLFERDGTAFTEFLRERRLLFARRMLVSPRFDGRRIADIALDAGFADISYFNREFRRRFGLTPTDFRNGRRA